ncbi:MAG: VCBS repeat-containing protein, partial [Limisphaerales bacterium]
YGMWWFEQKKTEKGVEFVQHEIYGKPKTEPYAAGEFRPFSEPHALILADINGDGLPDLVTGKRWYAHNGGDPGGKEPAVLYWFEQKRAGKDVQWIPHKIDDDSGVGTQFEVRDMNGDGKPELVVHTGGQLGFAELNWKDPTEPAKFWAISPTDAKKYFRYTHGYGFGDVNGDGRADILERDGWWEQPKDYHTGGLWKFHPAPFAPEGLRGGGQMLVYDVNGDGIADVITSWDAHGYGLAWYEGHREGGEVKFREHVIMNNKPEHNRYGVVFSQLHSQVLADMDGDGVKDIVTGKRFWAHGPTKDAEPNAPAVLYWFKIQRNADKSVDFVPHLIDDNSGVGTQITVGDVNGDGLPDVISGNKKGLSVFLHQAKKVSKAEWEKSQPKPVAAK